MRQKIFGTVFVAFAFGLIGPINTHAFASPQIVPLGASGNYVILSQSGITNTGTTSITGDIGISPAAASFITGFDLILPSASAFSTSALVTGKIYAPGYADPTPANLTTAVGAIGTAITAANGRTVDDTDLNFNAGVGCVSGTCDLAGLTLAPGVYAFTGPGNVIITGDVTLSGSATDVWIFQIPGTLNISSAKKVLLTGGAVSANVFWSVAGATTLGTNSTFEGNILEAGSVIALQTGATLHGRALSQFAVTLDHNTVTVPTPATTGPVFIDTNVNGVLDVGEQSFNTIQSAVNAASPGNTIHVDAGNYPEDILINKPLTLNGANANIPYGNGRGAESILQPFSSGQAAISLSGAGTSDNVTINGFEITGTSSNNAIYCGLVGPSHLNIKFNYIHDIGTARGTGNVYAINYRAGNSNTTDINVSDNYINEVFNSTSSALGASVAIWFGQSNANGTVSNLTIARNTIRNIKSGLSTTEADGISIGVAWGVGTGGVSAPVISNNSITNISGGIAYGIQLSGKTPGAVVSKNTIDNINNGALGTSAAYGVRVPSTNTGSATVAVNNNRITNVLSAVDNGTANTVNATNNWWGTASSTLIAAKIMGTGPVTYTPWYINPSMTVLSTALSENDSVITITAPTIDFTETTDGAVNLPTGTSELVLGNDSVLNFASSTNAVLGGNVVIAGATTTLASFTLGDSLTVVNLSTPQTIGGETFSIDKAVKLSSGSVSAPIILTNSTISNASVSIPDGTTILAPSGWTGTIAPPKAGSSSGDAPSGFSVGSTVISVGSPDVVLVFDKPVTLTLSGVTGTVGYKSAGSNTWTTIGTTCTGTYDNPTGATFPGECAITNGTDTKILTYHFTTFGGFNHNAVPSTSSSRSGSRSSGGGASAVAPVVAVATPVAVGRVLGAATYRFSASLSAGARSDAVKELQDRLRAEGYLSAESTGYFGPLTVAAVKAYQSANGVSSTGFVGPLTIAKLNAETTTTTTTSTTAAPAGTVSAKEFVNLLISLGVISSDKVPAAQAWVNASGN